MFGLGVKELWDVPAEKQAGTGDPHAGVAAQRRVGQEYLYRQGNSQVALGFVLSLDYSNPYLSPFEEFQRWKTHPAIRAEMEGGRRVSMGRGLDESGYQAIPKLVFPGGALIGCSAGFVNVPRIKGTHTAMKSAMLAAEAAFEAIAADRSGECSRPIRRRSTRAGWSRNSKGCATPSRRSRIGAGCSERSMPGSTCG